MLEHWLTIKFVYEDDEDRDNGLSTISPCAMITQSRCRAISKSLGQRGEAIGQWNRSSGFTSLVSLPLARTSFIDKYLQKDRLNNDISQKHYDPLKNKINVSIPQPIELIEKQLLRSTGQLTGESTNYFGNQRQCNRWNATRLSIYRPNNASPIYVSKDSLPLPP